MGSKLEPGEYDCYQNALPDEPMFVLLARDLSAPGLVIEWATMRQRRVYSKTAPESDLEMANEAIKCAGDMVQWRQENDGKWRTPPDPAPEGFYWPPPHGWTCFHCGETFKTKGKAQDHFGSDPLAEPMCKIKASEGGLVLKIRDLEEQMKRYQAEDSDTDRAMAKMQAEHLTALKNAEEAGYNKGVRDMSPDLNFLEGLAISLELEPGRVTAINAAAVLRKIIKEKRG